MPDTPEEPPRRKIVLDLDWLPEPPAAEYTVTFLPQQVRAIARAGESVFEVAARHQIAIPTECGGKGTCGRCRVRVEGEPARPPTYVEKAFIPREDLAAQVRLSCRLRVESDLVVTVLNTPLVRRHR